MGGSKRPEVLNELGMSHDPLGATVRRALDHHDFERRENRRKLLHGGQVGMVVFQKWRWTEIIVTLGLIFVASLRKEWPMTFIAVRCGRR